MSKNFSESLLVAFIGFINYTTDLTVIGGIFSILILILRNMKLLINSALTTVELIQQVFEYIFYPQKRVEILQKWQELLSQNNTPKENQNE
jgi:hypothetical protein